MNVSRIPIKGTGFQKSATPFSGAQSMVAIVKNGANGASLSFTWQALWGLPGGAGTYREPGDDGMKRRSGERSLTFCDVF